MGEAVRKLNARGDASTRTSCIICVFTYAITKGTMPIDGALGAMITITTRQGEAAIKSSLCKNHREMHEQGAKGVHDLVPR